MHLLLVIKLHNNADRIMVMFETVRKQAGIYFFLTQNKSKSSKNFKKAVKSAGKSGDLECNGQGFSCPVTGGSSLGTVMLFT